MKVERSSSLVNRKRCPDCGRVVPFWRWLAGGRWWSYYSSWPCGDCGIPIGMRMARLLVIPLWVLALVLVAYTLIVRFSAVVVVLVLAIWLMLVAAQRVERRVR